MLARFHRALPVAASAPWLRSVCRMPLRSMCTSPEELRRTAEQAAAEMKAELAKLDDELTAGFGSNPDTAADVWMQSYYRHNESRLLPPATVRLLAANNAQPQFDPTTEAQTTLFVATVLRRLAADDTRRLFAQLCVAEGVGPDLVLAATRVAGDAAADLHASLRASVERHEGAKQFVDFVRHLDKVPVMDVMEWPVPSVDVSFQSNWKDTTSPFEFTANMARIKETLSEVHDWSLLCTSVLIEAAWASFYATGELQYIRRVIDVAAPWYEFQNDLGVEYVLNLDKALPKSLTANHDSTSVLAQTSRVAMWSLLMHSRSHAGVLKALGDEVGRLAEFSVVSHHQHSDAVAATGLTPAQARQRLAVFPALIHIVARAALDADAPSQ